MPRRKKSEYPEIDEIREDLDSLKSNVVELTQHIKKNGSTQASNLRERANDTIHDLQERSQEQVQKVEKQVRQKPGQSLAIAFAGGLLTSLLLRRRG